ncbi:YciI family protein [Sphingomonas aracearum]|uniref:Transcription initiation protein n=1 Tax=Sphingomonas aracearum TaxID=2283317 RepID=A0A369VSV3_9SPHN|nr:transcription initiation protein [Sphingomonas aracearum]RDE05486.1 transcription initiation protein [Sphingomonas aracearum]
MAKYLISFPSRAMQLGAEELVAAGVDSRTVIEQAKAAGVYVFAGGIDERAAPVLVAADGSTTPNIYPDSHLNGGFTVLDVSTREEAVAWAGKLAAACRCSQELRAFLYDPAS